MMKSNEIVPQAKPRLVAKPMTKSARMQLLIRPSTAEALGKLAQATGLSKNEVVNRILENYIDEFEADATMIEEGVKPTTGVALAPVEIAKIDDPNCMALMNMVNEDGYFSMAQALKNGMSYDEYKKAMNKLVTEYGYTTVNIPCVSKSGKKYFVTTLYFKDSEEGKR